jgi:hypothetical protein
MMNPEIEGHAQDSQEKGTGSFYEPHTIPKKWDVSAFVSRGTPAWKGADKEKSETAEQDQSDVSEDESASSNLDPFPQPRTIPGNWDVSDLK